MSDKIPAYLIRDMANASISREHDLREQLEMLATMGKFFASMAAWKTKDWKVIGQTEFGKLVADAINAGDIGGMAEALKESVVATGFTVPPSWLMPTFFSVSITKPMAEIDRQQLQAIAQLITPFLTTLGGLIDREESETPMPSEQSAKALVYLAMLESRNQLSTVEEIVDATGGRVSDKTVKKHIAKMIADGQAERPEGKKGGTRLTLKGLKIAKALKAQIR